MGNHDSRVAGLEDASDFNFQAASAVYWTRTAIRDENREFLKTLPHARSKQENSGPYTDG
jgi:hypothetical protein